MSRASRFLLVLRIGALSGLLATVIAAGMMAFFARSLGGWTGSVPLGMLEVAKVAVLLLPIAIGTHGAFWFVMAGMAAGVWVFLLKRRLRAMWKLLVLTGTVGLVLGVAYPFVNFLLYQLMDGHAGMGWLYTDGSLLFTTLLGLPCALVCALVFRRHFVE